MRTKWIGSLGLTIASMALAGNAIGGIQVQVPAMFDSGSSNKVGPKRECDVEQAVAKQVFEKVSQQSPETRARTIPDQDSEDPFLMLTILDATVADNGWIGAKNVQVRADLIAKGRITASKVFKRNSKDEALGSKADTCPNMEQAASSVGQEIARWLNDAIKGIPTSWPSAPPAPTFAPVVVAAPRQISLHRKQEPAATGYAAIEDVAAVPSNEEGRANYRQYLSLPVPKAFVIYSNGRTKAYSNDPDAMSRALDTCVNEGKACWLYAVDNRIVWQASEGKRVGLSARLRNK